MVLRFYNAKYCVFCVLLYQGQFGSLFIPPGFGHCPRSWPGLFLDCLSVAIIVPVLHVFSYDKSWFNLWREWWFRVSFNQAQGWVVSITTSSSRAGSFWPSFIQKSCFHQWGFVIPHVVQRMLIKNKYADIQLVLLQFGTSKCKLSVRVAGKFSFWRPPPLQFTLYNPSQCFIGGGGRSPPHVLSSKH